MRLSHMRGSIIGLAVTLVIVTTSPLSAVATAQQEAAPQCQASGPLARIAELPEASGVAVSRRSPGRLWSHNDSGEAVLVALDTRGAVTGRVRLSGVKVEDWEAVAVGSCPGGRAFTSATLATTRLRESASRFTASRNLRPRAPSSSRKPSMGSTPTAHMMPKLYLSHRMAVCSL